MNKNQRIALLAVLIGVMSILAVWLVGGVAPSRERLTVMLWGLFMLAFTILLFEHYFAAPRDVIAAGVSLITLLAPARSLFRDWGAWYLVFLWYEVVLVVLATTALLLLTEEKPDSWRNRVSNALRVFTTRVGSGRIQYFFLFFLSLLFFVSPATAPFWAFLFFGLLVFLIEPQRLVLTLPAALRRRTAVAGEILAVEGGKSFLIKLRSGTDAPAVRLGDVVEFRYQGEGDVHRRAAVVEKLFLDQAQWVRAVTDPAVDATTSTLATVDGARPGHVYRLGREAGADFVSSLVGFVGDGSDIATLKFLRVGGANVQEGDLVQVSTNAGPIVYQVVNAVVDSESLDARNQADFVVGEALQLGRWNEARGTFERHGWVPAARAPVVKLSALGQLPAQPDEVVLGKIPGTDLSVLLNAREAVSHHTAVLGVTGVGKSVFTRELVRKLATDPMRVIVVDFTREWRKKLTGTELPLLIPATEAEALRKTITALTVETSKYKDRQDPAVIKNNRLALFNGFRTGIDGFLSSTEPVRVLELPDVSNAEGILEYTQWFFRTLFLLARDKKLSGKRVCVVLEEAHTVIPEWNFVGIGDKSAQAVINNISQIALQGRKYQVGFIVIAQRTATVSKTVLTQCNTIIAFKCFDDTSLNFLGNYLPAPVVEALPNLGFRRAVAVGKAIRGDVPLIFEVPDLSASEAEPVAATAATS